jgi:glycosyltransferase involved in cell wall biosynthesis
MNSSPLVSVVMLSYNHAHLIDETIQSIVAQSQTSCEFIIVDNQSTDDSWKIIQRWQQSDPRIKPVRPSQNLTIAGALNFGINQAAGDYIARIDSDDVWLPQRLERQLNFMTQPGNENVGVCGTYCLLIDPSGQVVGKKEFPVTHSECVRAFWYRNPFCHTATLIRRRCFDEYGLYDESYNFAEDLELWFRFGQTYELANLPEHLTRYRVLSGNVTLRKHRSVIDATLRARRRAVTRYGYRMRMIDRASFAFTWAMRWMPRTWVHGIFYNCLLKQCTRLWTEPTRPMMTPATAPPLQAAGPRSLSELELSQKPVCNSSISLSPYSTSKRV